MTHTKPYRPGAIGALIDEYERAVAELKALISGVGAVDYETIVDTVTTDEDCRSIATMMRHVVSSGYGYANNCRRMLGLRPQPRTIDRMQQANLALALDELMNFTAETFEGRWEMDFREMMSLMLVRTSWGPVFDIEQLLEHAIVHILRHRRQTERFILRLGSNQNLNT